MHGGQFKREKRYFVLLSCLKFRTFFKIFVHVFCIVNWDVYCEKESGASSDFNNIFLDFSTKYHMLKWVIYRIISFIAYIISSFKYNLTLLIYSLYLSYYHPGFPFVTLKIMFACVAPFWSPSTVFLYVDINFPLQTHQKFIHKYFLFGSGSRSIFSTVCMPPQYPPLEFV